MGFQPIIKMADNQVIVNLVTQHQQNEEEPILLWDFVILTSDGLQSSILKPSIEVKDFELKPQIIQMVQMSAMFGGAPNDDLNLHIFTFLEICYTFYHNAVFDDVIRLWFFPFSLKDKAKA
ncbi:hypothetical protein ACH5RR_006878 [Cinchona calisaya]|uniref:Uncharacterized protein n=1 Tax=Cinchona calisaya TaxID=153742 RepID=A0ABD3AQ79_9GENT